ncbi:MAG TPA: UbiD family decarboxylase, partial [Dehalococcoidia bacterium]|nr:UbiD family decarboxylase [Dehalococcoidia bacterium]
YEETFPEEIIHIDREVSARYQVTALTTHLESEKRFPILVFHNVLNDHGKSPFPLVTFLMASRKRLAGLLETSIEMAGPAFCQRVQSGIKPVVVPRSRAPVKEVVEVGGAVELRSFPALIHHEMDPGPYITVGLLTCYDPDTGIENSAMHRGWMKGKDEIRVYLQPASHNFHIFRKHEARGQDMKVAFWIGHHPLAVLGCEAHVSVTASHYEAAGGALGEPLRLVPSETLGEDFLVPADAEVVIEGIIPHGQRRPEGPFGEFSRYSGPQKWHPFIKVTAVTRRRDPYWQDLIVGHTHWVGSLQGEGAAYEAIKRSVPGLLCVYAPMSGAGRFHLYLKIRKTVEGQGRTALLAALNAYVPVKHAFVFDEDVDIFDEKEVLLALATRFQGDRDLLVVENCMGSGLDPSADGPIGTKVGFDCTKPAPPAQFPHRLKVPAEVLDQMKLEDFIPRERLLQIPYEPWG